MNPSHKITPPSYDQLMGFTRRHFLGSGGLGLGAMALSQLMGSGSAQAMAGGVLGAPHRFAKVAMLSTLTAQAQGAVEAQALATKTVALGHAGLEPLVGEGKRGVAGHGDHALVPGHPVAEALGQGALHQQRLGGATLVGIDHQHAIFGEA
jgi:hypothetical protein